ncbi:MAG: hypothetical protein WC277_07420 [Bacilli bacterium]|jgi:hypothetical protein
MTATLTGDKELARRLDQLSKSGAKKACRAGLNAGANPILKAARAAVNSAPMPAGAGQGWASLKKTARQSLRKRFVKGKLDVIIGFGVGSTKTKAAKKRKMSAHERYVAGQGFDRRLKGAGISEANIHWFVLGTAARYAKTVRGKSLKRARYTGTVSATLAGIIPNATMQSAGTSVDAARRKIAEVIEREASKQA